MGGQRPNVAILMDYLLIDGNNLACKAQCAYDAQTTSGVNTSVIFGFLSQLLSIQLDFIGYQPLVVWDGGHDERDRISRDGVRSGLIPEAYKENRHTGSGLSLDHDQVAEVQRFLKHTNVPQIRSPGNEADDVIASYCRKYSGNSKVLCITNDKDYFQLVSDNVFVVRRFRGDQDIWDRNKFFAEYGIEPCMWVDVGGLCGDTGDNIFGVPGVGEKTAIKYIIEYGGALATVDAFRKKFAALRAEFGDLCDQESLKKLGAIGSGDRKTYDCTSGNRHFSGVALAVEEKRAKKCSKTEVKIAMYGDRVKLALELKRMISDINVPDIHRFDRFDEAATVEFCDQYELNEIRARLHRFKDV